jgi:hypothetical protein
MRIQISLLALNFLFNKFIIKTLGGYSSIGRTAVCGIVYPCSIQGIHLIYI